MEEKIDSVPTAPEEAAKVSVQEVEPVSGSPDQSKKFKPLWIIIVVVLLILGAVGYFLLFQGRNSQQSAKVYRVGVLSALDFFDPAVGSFKQEMTNLGYIEGKNIVYDVQKGPAPVGNQNIIKKFVEDKVDLIYVFPTEATIEAKEGTKGTAIPIISIGSYLGGLIESIQRPGGNITGVHMPIAEISAKRLEIMHEIAPKAKRIWIPHLKDYPTAEPSLGAIRPLAKVLGLTIVEAAFANPQEMTNYLNERAGDPGMDAILLIPEPISIIPAFADQIMAFAGVHNLPTAGPVVSDSDKGPLFDLIPNNLEYGRLAAPLADKIFKGISAGSLPIITPENDLEINYKVAQKLRLTISEGLLSRAKKIVR